MDARPPTAEDIAVFAMTLYDATASTQASYYELCERNQHIRDGHARDVPLHSKLLGTSSAASASIN
ncbi:hypothetical protein PsYK624_126220 [Phanerochaete sordida]|uniref:Uncharacterized protein n=1 Tax=Phanerochaete sordida TaxID=48140 RepID=A0A9P3GJQ4_9APHY|nr:hypothetical protein PsYK624_126220 [Phanerochaete sordida]